MVNKLKGWKDWTEEERNRFLNNVTSEHLSGGIDWESVVDMVLYNAQTSIGENKNRTNLEWLVKLCIDDAIISISRGRELLGFQHMEDMREWLNKHKGA